MKESILPRMRTATQDTVLGGLIKHVKDRKMVIVLGEPGEGKTITLLDFCMQHTDSSYYYRCSPNTTMNSLLIFLAKAVGVRVVGDNDQLQESIQEKLHENPNYCFAFDEVEYLTCGNGRKIDVLRQIFDDTDVPIILCGTYELKDMISGERKKNRHKTHNHSQIIRRLRKEEFELIEEHEVYNYLSQLENQYAVTFHPQVKSDLVSQCRDRQSGGLGNFIEIIELLFSQVRPEWKEISHQIMKEEGRILHTHSEQAQAFTGIKPRKKEDDEKIETDNTADILQDKYDKIETHVSYVDVSKLPNAYIDREIYIDSLRHKMTM